MCFSKPFCLSIWVILILFTLLSRDISLSTTEHHKKTFLISDVNIGNDFQSWFSWILFVANPSSPINI